MIGRIWTTRVDEGRASEYEAFAKDISLPMFRLQHGFRGVAMFRRGEECLVVTLWQDAASVAALARSESYVQTVSEIAARGFLQGEQTVDTFDAHLLADLPS